VGFLVGFGWGFGRLLQKELRLGVDGFGLGAYISPSRRSKTTRLVRETSGGLVWFSNIKQAVESCVWTDL